MSIADTFMQRLDLDEIRQTVSDAATTESAQAEVSNAIDNILAMDAANLRQRQSVLDAFALIGRPLQHRASRSSQMLRQNIRSLAALAETDKPVDSLFTELQQTLATLDPAKQDFSGGFFDRLLVRLGLRKSPADAWLERLKHADEYLGSALKALANQRIRLKRDNITLIEDSIAFSEVGQGMQSTIRHLKNIESGLLEKLPAIKAESRQFIENELLYNARQRIMDLQQQLMVLQQGQVTLEMIRRNNDQLIRGIDRTTHVSANALHAASALALAASRQESILQQLSAASSVVEQMMQGAAGQLADSQQQMDTKTTEIDADLKRLIGHFVEINSALEDISMYREDALPKIAQSVAELEHHRDTSPQPTTDMAAETDNTYNDDLFGLGFLIEDTQEETNEDPDA